MAAGARRNGRLGVIVHERLEKKLRLARPAAVDAQLPTTLSPPDARLALPSASSEARMPFPAPKTPRSRATTRAWRKSNARKMNALRDRAGPFRRLRGRGRASSHFNEALTGLAPGRVGPAPRPFKAAPTN